MNLSIETQMREIWSEVFGDTSDYISLLFDNYYAKENVSAFIYMGRVVASTFSIPYTFKNAENNLLRGQYLCGLATLPPFRKLGIMGQMLKDWESQAKAADLDFLFLIPADDHLREYYHRLGYDNSAKRGVVRINQDNIQSLLSEYPRKINERDSNPMPNIAELKENNRDNIGVISEISVVDNSNIEYIKSTNLWQELIENIHLSETKFIADNQHILSIQNSEESDNSIAPEGCKEYVDKTPFILQHSSKDICVLLEEKVQAGGVIIYAKDASKHSESSTPDQSENPFPMASIICIDSDNRIWQMAGEFSGLIEILTYYFNKTIISSPESLKLRKENDRNFDRPTKESWQIILTTEDEKNDYQKWRAAHPRRRILPEMEEEYYGMVRILRSDTTLEAHNIYFRLLLD